MLFLLQRVYSLNSEGRCLWSPHECVRGEKRFWFLAVLLSCRSTQYLSSPNPLICLLLIHLFPSFMAFLPSPSAPHHHSPLSSPTKLFLSTLFLSPATSGSGQSLTLPEDAAPFVSCDGIRVAVSATSAWLRAGGAENCGSQN